MDENTTLQDELLKYGDDLARITNLKVTGAVTPDEISNIISPLAKDSYSIGEYNGEGHLENLDLSEVKARMLNSSSFSDCEKLKTIRLPQNLERIPERAFFFCTNLSNVQFPKNLTEIKSEAFKCCQALKNLTIPDGVTSIGLEAFVGCTNLQEISIPKSIKIIGRNAFGSDDIQKVYIEDLKAWLGIDFLDYAANPVGQLYLNGEELTDLVIPEGTTTIKEYSFFGKHFSSITIPNSLTTVGKAAFAGYDYNDDLVSNDILYINDMKAWLGIDFKDYYSNPGGRLMLNGKEVKELEFPTGYETIPEFAFARCLGLTSVTIPEGVTHFEANAFWRCTNLKSIYLFCTTPPSFHEIEYYDDLYDYCTLYVPTGMVETYRNSREGWYIFKNIVEFDAETGIQQATTSASDSAKKKVARYGINAQRLSAPVKGVNIVKYSDGSVRKEIVK